MDGGCSFAVKLLVDDGFDESFERRLRTGDAHGEGTGAFDELAELRIGERIAPNRLSRHHNGEGVDCCAWLGIF